MKKIKFIVERTNTGYSAYAEKYPVFTVGANLQELKENMVEAINLYLEDQNQDKLIDDKGLEVAMDLPQFFAFYQVIDAEALSKRIGIDQSLLSQYIEGSKKPTAAQTRKILASVQQLGRELAEIQVVL